MSAKRIPHVRLNPKLHAILKAKSLKDRTDLEKIHEECLRIGMIMKRLLPREVKAQ